MIAGTRTLHFELCRTGNVDNFLQLQMLHQTDCHFIQQVFANSILKCQYNIFFLHLPSVILVHNTAQCALLFAKYGTLWDAICRYIKTFYNLWNNKTSSQNFMIMNTKPEMLLIRTNISIIPSSVYNKKYEEVFVREMLPSNLLSNNLLTTFWMVNLCFYSSWNRLMACEILILRPSIPPTGKF
jgi:hypothetical protein